MKSLELNKIYNIDCVDGMNMISDNNIDLTVTSPPYDNLRTYNGYSFDFESVAKELYRITKIGGIVVWIVGDATIKGSETGTSFKQALYFKDVGFNLHGTMIYQKSKPIPQSQHPRYTPSFEYMFILCKGYPPKSFNPITEPTKHQGKTTTYKGQRNKDSTFRHEEPKPSVVQNEKRKTNIWTITNKSIRGIEHPATFPEKLAEDHILSWSNVGDIVLDPFSGSGTTAKMAKINNRRFIGFEISKEYCNISENRLKDL